MNSWDLGYCTICPIQREKSPCDFCLFFVLRAESCWEAYFILLGLLPSTFFFPLTMMTGLQTEICINWHSPFSSAVLKYKTLYCYILVKLVLPKMWVDENATIYYGSKNIFIFALQNFQSKIQSCWYNHIKIHFRILHNKLKKVKQSASHIK